MDISMISDQGRPCREARVVRFNGYLSDGRTTDEDVPSDVGTYADPARLQGPAADWDCRFVPSPPQEVSVEPHRSWAERPYARRPT